MMVMVLVVLLLAEMMISKTNINNALTIFSYIFKYHLTACNQYKNYAGVPYIPRPAAKWS